MINYDNKNWFSFLFKRTGYHYEGVILSILVYAGIAALLTFIHLRYNFKIFQIPPTFHTVLGLVIGLLLVFRTNTAYERWWDGRKLLGSLVNTSRNLAIKFKAYQIEDKEIYQLILAFFWTLKESLRHKNFSNASDYLPQHFLHEFNDAQHKPNHIALLLSQKINALLQSKKINAEQFLILEQKVSELTDILGSCERIKNTPIPLGYALHLKRILLIYLITLPFGFIQILEWWSIPIVMVVFYTMIGIELIAEEIEDPFGTDVNDLPIDELEEKVKLNIAEIER